MPRRWRRWLAVILAAIVVGGLGWRWWHVRRSRSVMEAIDDAMRHGRYAMAARELSALLQQSPDSDRATYLLGVCEKAHGRAREADAAWATIPPESPFGGRALASRVDLLLEQGRFADAEQLIKDATDDVGLEKTARRMSLFSILVQQGRPEEAQRLIAARWRSLDAHGEGTLEQAVNLARLHIETRTNVPPAEALRAYLEQMGRLAPDDDRIWLARANLAIRSGAYDQARRWIDDCLRRRPLDPAVWRARLDWSMRTNRLPGARDALKHLPARPAAPAEVHRISAWMGSQRGDFECERRELAALVALAPEDFESLARLETLERQRPANTDTAEPRRPRVEIERDQARYRELYRRNQPSRDALEMAHLAERLGQRCEAILFLNAALAEEPDRAPLRASLHRLQALAHQPDDNSQTLFDRLPRDCTGDEPPRDVLSGDPSPLGPAM